MSATILPFKQKHTKQNADSSPVKHSSVVLIHFPISNDHLKRRSNADHTGYLGGDSPLPAA